MEQAPEQATHAAQSHGCARLADWQGRYVSPASGGSWLAKEDGERSAMSLQSLQLDARSLIWLEGCDAAATRSAVKLAELVGATVHVGQSPGSHSLKTVMGSSGWLATTLSEVSARGDLVITLGDGVLTESPLLAERFFQSSNVTRRLRWIHITPQPTLSLSGSRQPDEVVCIPR
jgi:hypothetical protein